MSQKSIVNARKRPFGSRFVQSVSRNWILYLFLLPTLLYLILFNYWLMYGIQIAFKKFIPAKGIEGSAWVGLKHFQKFFKSYMFTGLLSNTVVLSVYQFKANAVVNGITKDDWQRHLQVLESLDVETYTGYWQSYYDAHNVK